MPQRGHLDESNPEIIWDMENPRRPRTVFGMLIAALKERREAGDPPFTILSCDNLPHNGGCYTANCLEFGQGLRSGTGRMDPCAGGFSQWHGGLHHTSDRSSRA